MTDDPRAPLLDTCGTGGAAKTFNISTAAALVVAGARGGTNAPVERVRVAKHGGRSRTGRGSAEVLAVMGVNIDASPEAQARCLERAGVCFSFAVNHHPAMKFAAGPRKSLGFPTVFNLLGPLTNPAGARRQLLGVWDGRYAPLVASALVELGCDGAMVVHGLDGMDEITTCDPTFIARVKSAGTNAGGPRVETLTFDPLAVGVARSRRGEFVVDSAEASAALIERIIGGDRSEPVRAARGIVVINAAAALIVAGMTERWEPAVALAEESIDAGRAGEALRLLRETSRGG